MNRILDNIVKPVVLMKRAQQLSETEWDVWQEALTVNMDTTIQELYDWVKNRSGFSGPHCGELNILFSEIWEK